MWREKKTTLKDNKHGTPVVVLSTTTTAMIGWTVKEPLARISLCLVLLTTKESVTSKSTLVPGHLSYKANQ
jgi:hypothetical protein